MAKFSIKYSEIVYYEEIEIEAANEEAAREQIMDRVPVVSVGCGIQETDTHSLEIKRI